MDFRDVIFFSLLITSLTAYWLITWRFSTFNSQVKLPKEPIRRALKIGELLSHKVLEVTLHGFTPDGNPARVEFTTLPWGMTVTVGDERISFFPPKCEEVVDEIMLLLSRLTNRVVLMSSGIALTVEEYDNNVSGGLVFRLNEAEVLVLSGFERYRLKEFLKDHKEVEKLLWELHKIKRAAKTLVGALKLIEGFESS